MFPETWTLRHLLRHCFAEILVNQHLILAIQETQMAAIDNLTANIAQLKTDVDALLALPAGVAEAAVQAAADAVAAVDAEVKAKLPA
jgi:hypothetical protein